MTDDEIRIAMAEACGWVWYRLPLLNNGGPYRVLVNPVHADGQTLKRADGTEPIAIDMLAGPEYQVSDYRNDLNVMHEVEEMIGPYDIANYGMVLRALVERDWRMNGKATELFRIGDWFYATAHATARQRAEAFLRTVGKWEEPK